MTDNINSGRSIKPHRSGFPKPELKAFTAPTTPREVAIELRKTMRCNCDLDNWEPEQATGHSYVCRIHKAALAQFAADKT